MLIMSTIKLNTIIKLSIIFIILLLLLTPIYSIGENDNAHAYTVPVVVNFINISDDGQCFYSDEVTYTLDESGNVVYYTIDKSSNEVIDNISLECEDIYYDININDTKNHTNIKLSLYTDESKKNKLTNRSVKIIYHYTSINAVDLYNDVAVFNYTPWADSTSTVSKLETYITYPATRDDIKIYDNPPYLISSHSWVNKHRYETRYKQISPDSNLTQVVLMPNDAFKSNEYTNNINQLQKAEITKNQEDYAKDVAFNNTMGYLLIAVSVLLMLTPLAISINYFKKSGVDDAGHDAIVDLKDNYIKANMILNDKKDTVNADALYATILELVNKKLINVTHRDDELFIQIAKDKDNNLEDHEKIIYDALIEHINKQKALNEIYNGIDKTEVNNLYEKFKQVCKKSYSITEYFTDKTSKLLKYYSFTTIIYVLIAFILINMLKPDVPIFTWTFRCLIVLIPIIIFAYVISSKISNNWNKNGRIQHQHWKQFETYLNDYSKIENNPPETVSNWADYIVYSATCGVDLSFRQNMIRYIDKHNRKELLDNDLIKLFYHDANRSLYLVD